VQFQKICVLGLGYIGLPSASTFATHGIKVIGVDVNRKIVETLQNGGLHIHEPGLRTLVQAAIRSGNLIIRDQPEDADAFIIAVPTPFFDDKSADLRFVESACESILPYLRKGNLVVLESTSPPRTTVDVVAPILEKPGLKAGTDFSLAYTPERVLPGQILRELIENARVIGGIDRVSAEAGCDLYKTFVTGEIYLTDATTAEMVKLMENTYRDVNIAIANEFSRLADRFGVDVWEAIGLANRHPRVSILRPGPGVGGHCISVDPWFLVDAAPDLSKLILTARMVNDSQPDFVIDLFCRAAGHARGGEKPLSGQRIAVLGLAYKPDVDDLRESPAIEIACKLKEAGAVVTAYEPFKPDAVVRGLTIAPTLEEALKDADMIGLLVAHSPVRELNPAQVAAMTPARTVIDTGSIWASEVWEPHGFRIIRLGNGKLKLE
jgi:UDP-N-acetyl-D-mannosaminuronic acid dehydrogenase